MEYPSPFIKTYFAFKRQEDGAYDPIASTLMTMCNFYCEDSSPCLFDDK